MKPHPLFATLMLVCLGAASWGATVTFDDSAGTQDWNTAANWDTNTVPSGGDTVIIPTGKTAVISESVSSAIVAGNITVNSGGTLTLGTNGSLQLEDGSVITINGTFVCSGSSTHTISQRNAATPSINPSTLAVGSGGLLDFSAGVHLEVNRGITITNSGGTIRLGKGALLTSADNNNYNDFTSASGTVRWTYDVDQSAQAALLQFSDVTIGGTLEVTAGGGNPAGSTDTLQFITDATGTISLPTVTSVDTGGFTFTVVNDPGATDRAIDCTASPIGATTVTITSPGSTAVYGNTVTRTATAMNGGAITWSTTDSPVVIDPLTGYCGKAGTALLTASTPRTLTSTGGSSSVNVNVAPRTVTITVPTKSITTGTTPTFSASDYSISNLVSGDSLGTVTLSTSATSSSPAGTYTISVNVTSLNANYQISGTPSGTLTIVDPAPPTQNLTSGGGGGGGCGVGGGLGLVLAGLAMGLRRRR